MVLQRGRAWQGEEMGKWCWNDSWMEPHILQLGGGEGASSGSFRALTPSSQSEGTSEEENREIWSRACDATRLYQQK